MTVLDNIPLGLVDGIGVVGLLVVQFWMMATGRLVTRREADAIAADRDVWRAAAREQKGLTSQLLIGQETTNRLLRALPHVQDAEAGGP